MLFLTNFYWSVQQAIIYYEHFHRSPSTWPLICPVTRPSKQVPEGLHWHPKGKQLFMDSGKGAWKLLSFEHLSHECNRKDQYCCRWICTRNKCCCPVEQFWWRFQLSVCTWQVFRLPLCAIRCIWLKKKKVSCLLHALLSYKGFVHTYNISLCWKWIVINIILGWKWIMINVNLNWTLFSADLFIYSLLWEVVKFASLLSFFVCVCKRLH